MATDRVRGHRQSQGPQTDLGATDKFGATDRVRGRTHTAECNPLGSNCREEVVCCICTFQTVLQLKTYKLVSIRNQNLHFHRCFILLCLLVR